jgi:hypothetical protein
MIGSFGNKNFMQPMRRHRGDLVFFSFRVLGGLFWDLIFLILFLKNSSQDEVLKEGG